MRQNKMTILVNETDEITSVEIKKNSHGHYLLPLLEGHPLELVLRRTATPPSSLEVVKDRNYYPGCGIVTMLVPESLETPHFYAIRHATGSIPKNVFFLFCTSEATDPHKLNKDLHTLMMKDKLHKVPPFTTLLATLDIATGQKTRELAIA